MKIYTVERMDKYDYDFSVQLMKGGCYIDRNKAIERAKEIYESMCAEYEDEMKRYSDVGALYVEEDDEFGYYQIQFGFDEDHEFHCVTVEEWEMEE